MNFKLGDRVYFDYNPNNPKNRDQCGFGVIYRITTYGSIVYCYDVRRDEQDEDDLWYIEPNHGELIVHESVYNSKLYKILY